MISAANPALRASPAGQLKPAELATVFDAAFWHAVLPVCVRAAKAALAGDAAEDKSAAGETVDVLGKATDRVTYLAARGLMLTHQGERAMTAFRDAAVDGIVVKGATFARYLYPEPALRTFTDIDVIIRPEHRAKTGEIMRSLGFELHTFEDRVGKDYFEDKWKLASQNNMIVEVHANLVHSPKLRGYMSLTYDDIFAAGDGNPEAPEALLLIAGAHGAIGHQFDKLQHLVDVLRAATGRAVDVSRLRRAALRSGVMLPLVAALDLAGRAFGAQEALGLARQLDSSIVTRMAGRLLSPQLVITAQSETRNRGSWRRKTFRQLLRLDAKRRGPLDVPRERAGAAPAAT